MDRSTRSVIRYEIMYTYWSKGSGLLREKQQPVPVEDIYIFTQIKNNNK